MKTAFRGLAVRRNRGWAGIVLGSLAVITCLTSVRLVVSPRGARAQTRSTSETCGSCHRRIWETYQRTGMARSFYRPFASNSTAVLTTSAPFYHRASDSYFTMLRRDGKYFQRRYQLDSTGRQINGMEKPVDYIMGSGNHARAFLSRTKRGTLVEMPLGWYAEKGGYWAMNPGFDRPDHDGFRRPIAYDCMFCHNGYPEIPPGHEGPFAEPVYAGSLPEGIDCQRCHGSGARHMQVAKTAGATAEQIRNSIVNPSRLSTQRQMELCMVCHLETTSFPLPNALQRYERGPFSYRPGEALEGFLLNFDHAPGKGRDDKFEIVSAAYRLRKSACFLRSEGKLLCTTCHNPHEASRGEEAVRHYAAVCRQCHGGAFDRLIAAGRHVGSLDCAGCHMPKRRTEDVVHVVATDHYIQRHPPAGDLLADLPERHETDGSAYRGPVVLYYPEKLPATPENSLYLAIAQVNQGSNLTEGIAQLSSAIDRYRPVRAEFYYALAEAWRNSDPVAKALPFYREAVRRNPNFVVGLQKLASALRHSGQNAEALGTLQRAAAIAPDSASTWHELGLTYRALGKAADAIAAFEKAIELNPDLPEAHNNLGILLAAAGQGVRAESAFREAIRIQPDYADAHANLAAFRSGTGDFAGARDHFEIALQRRPNDAVTRYNYAMALGRARQFDEAERQLETSLRSDPHLADAHQLLADLLMAKGNVALAVSHYREVIRLRPESGRAQLALGTALLAAGDAAGAIEHLRKASADADPVIREQAVQALRQLGR